MTRASSFFFLSVRLFIFIFDKFSYDNVQRKGTLNMEEKLAIGSVPVSIAAKAYGKDACWIRAGLICGWLTIGYATRNGKRVTAIEEMNSKYGRINYYISPKLLYEQTGYAWKGER